MTEVALDELSIEETPVVICEGLLTKKGRGRSTLAFMAKPTWKSRMVVLYSNKLLEYWDNDVLKGQLSLDNAMMKDVESFEADDHQNAFEIANMTSGEKILFTHENVKVVQEWKYKIRTVVENTWKREQKLEELSKLLNCKQSEYFTLDETYNRSVLVAELSSVGGKQRYEYVYYDAYISALIKQIHSQLRVIGFQEKLLKTWHAKVIRIRPFEPSAEKYKNYYASFHDGILLLEFQTGQVENNLEELGSDLCDVLGIVKHSRHR